MTAVVGSVSIDLEARLSKFESDMGRAARIAEKQAEAIAKAADRSAARQEAAAAKAAAAQIRAAELAAAAQIAAIEKAAAAQSAAFKKSLAETEQRISKLGALAAIAGVVFVAFEKHLIDTADNLNDLSQKFGISTETLSAWSVIAKQSGTDIQGLAAGAKFLSKDLDGTEVKLKSMGIALRDATGAVKPMETVMEEIAKKVASYRDNAERASLMTAIFGKAGVDLIPAMVAMGERIDETKKKVNALGGAVGPELAREADRFNDNLENAKVAAAGFGNAVLTTLLPALNQMIEDEVDAAGKHGDLQRAGEALGTHLAFLAGLFKDVADNVRGLVGGIDDLVGKIPGLKGFSLTGVNNAVAGMMLNPGGTMQGFMDWATGLAQVKTGTEDLEKAQVRAMVGTKDWDSAWQAFAATLKTNAPHIKTEADLAKEAAAAQKAAAAQQKATAEATKKRAEEEAHLLVIMGEGLAAHKAFIKTMGDYAKAQDRAREAIEQRHEIEDRNLRLAALDEDARRRAENAIQAMADATRDYNALLAAGIPVTEEMLAAEIAVTEAKLNDADATARLAEANKRAAAEVARDWESATDSMLRGLADFFTGAEDGLDGLLDSFARAGQQLASSALMRAMQGGSSANVWGLQGATSGARLTGFVGGVANAYQGYRSGNVWQGIMGGAQAGAQYGGTTGAVVGGIIGGILAAFRSKPKPPEIQVAGGQAQIDRVEASGSGAFGAVRVNTVGSGQMPSAEVLAAITKFDQAISQFMTADQISAASARLASFEIDLKKGAATIDNVLGERFSAILSTFPEDIQAVVRGAGDLQAQVEKLGEVLQFPTQLAELMAALGEGEMLAGLSQFEQHVYALNKEFDAYAEQAEALGATQDQLAQIETYRTNALQRLAEAQAGAAEAEDAAAEQFLRNQRELNALIGDVIWDDYLAGLSDFDRQMAELHKHFQDVYDQATSLGASERELAVIRDAEARAVDRLMQTVEDLVAAADPRGSIYDSLEPLQEASQALANALQRVAQYLLGLRVSEQFSPLTPQQRLAEAQAQFNAMLVKARAGNVDAIGALPQYAQTLLEQASAFWASGSQYDAIFEQVSQALQNITQRFGSTSTDPFVRMANALELHLPSIDAALQQIASSPAAMPSYDTGTDFVPYDQVAKIHRGEAVLTASENRARLRGGQTQVAPDLRDIALALREIAQQSKAEKSDASAKLGRAAAALEKIAFTNRQGK